MFKEDPTGLVVEVSPGNLIDKLSLCMRNCRNITLNRH